MQFLREVIEQDILMLVSDYLKLAQELADLLEKVFPSASNERESGRSTALRGRASLAFLSFREIFAYSVS